MYDIYSTDFCIGDAFCMGARECSDLYDLYKFYCNFKYSIKLLSLSQDDYKKLVSSKYYIKNIFKKRSVSFMLEDLFDLEYLNKDNYGEFFVKCTDIIKCQKEKKQQ